MKWALSCGLFAAVVVGGAVYIAANTECETIHHDTVKQEHLEKCAPAHNFVKCLQRLGYNTEYVCKAEWDF